jgi:putative Mn2+ efflux pump MntP
LEGLFSRAIDISCDERNSTMQSILLCSIDSFAAALGMGLVERSESRNRKFIIAFAVCDFVSTLAGLTLRSTLTQLPQAGPGLVLAPLLLAVTACFVAYSGKLPALLVSIPILLGLDNFVAGLLDGSVHAFPSLLISALSSGLLAWAGFALARGAKPEFSPPWAGLAGFGLLLFAFFN